MAAQATAPITQLASSPADPTPGAPPMIWNVLSIGAMVWPWSNRKMRPRQTRNPPSVTMNAGTPP